MESSLDQQLPPDPGSSSHISAARSTTQSSATYKARSVIDNRPAASFRSLPSELRLRVLQHTHLGPPGTGDYDPRFERLVIRNSKLEPGVFDFTLQRSVSECCRPFTRPRARPRLTCAPRCRCRVLPTALFLVDRQMYREAALDAFYPDALFDFCQDDLRLMLAFLRDVVPQKALARMQRIHFTMTPGQCEGWADGALACGYPEGYLQNVTRVYCAGSSHPALDYKADWRAFLDFLAAHADLARLSITVDMAQCSWLFMESPYATGRDTDSMFRFIYGFMIDVVTAMCCSLKTVGDIKLELGLYQGITPWLEREVLGRGDGVILPPPKRRGPQPYWDPPVWHNLNQRLEGSNYIPAV